MNSGKREYSLKVILITLRKVLLSKENCLTQDMAMYPVDDRIKFYFEQPVVAFLTKLAGDNYQNEIYWLGNGQSQLRIAILTRPDCYAKTIRTMTLLC